MKVLVQNQQKKGVALKTIKGLAREILKDLGCHNDAELSIVLTDNTGIRELNKRYLNKDSPTDVLSFPMDDPKVLGDVVISIETAKLQAKKNGATMGHEMARLLIHGILHLLGFDHEKSAAEARKMKREEKRLIDRAVEKGFVRKGRG